MGIVVGTSAVKETSCSKSKRSGWDFPPRSLLYRWVTFIFGVSLLAALLYVAPALERMGKFGQQITILRESGLETSAIFYGEVERIWEIEFELLHLRDYSPRKDMVLQNHSEKELQD